MEQLKSKLIDERFSAIEVKEYNILKKQATISAVTDLFKWIILSIYPFLIYKLHLILIEKKLYENYDIASNFIITMLSIAFLIGLVFMSANIENLINGFFNREFWILNKHSELNNSKK